jgi:hypothetical protein
MMQGNQASWGECTGGMRYVVDLRHSLQAPCGGGNLNRSLLCNCFEISVRHRRSGIAMSVRRGNCCRESRFLCRSRRTCATNAWPVPDAMLSSLTACWSLSFAIHCKLKSSLKLSEDRPARRGRSHVNASELGHECVPHSLAAFFKKLGPDRKLLGRRSDRQPHAPMWASRGTS